MKRYERKFYVFSFLSTRIEGLCSNLLEFLKSRKVELTQAVLKGALYSRQMLNITQLLALRQKDTVTTIYRINTTIYYTIATVYIVLNKLYK